MPAKLNLFESVFSCLQATELDEKMQLCQALQQNWALGVFDFTPLANPPVRIADPGRPLKPKLVNPKDLPKRRLGSPEGRIALMHAIAHIEFNAVNLALDAVYRFQTMPIAFFEDWIGVAAEECYHFQLIREHLANMGADYGDLPAHDGLWMTTYETDFDPMIRMALVPRTLEARGLDVTPAMISKLRALGDKRGVEILKILLRDEVGHVAVGTRWYRYLCEQRGLNPFTTFKDIVDTYYHGDLRGPFNYDARAEAGFCAQELDWLQSMDTPRAK